MGWVIISDMLRSDRSDGANQMASKIQERIYVERAKELLGWNCQLNEIPEPVDFEVSD